MADNLGGPSQVLGRDARQRISCSALSVEMLVIVNPWQAATWVRLLIWPIGCETIISTKIVPCRWSGACREDSHDT